MSEEELKQMDKEQLLGVIKAQQFEIERLNNRLKTSNDTCNYLRNTIDKAIEWIEENQYYFPRPDELLKILKGSDKGDRNESKRFNFIFLPVKVGGLLLMLSSVG